MLREILGEREFPREPEPELVMDDAEQVKAFAEAGRADGTMAAAYLFHTAHISQVIQGCREVLDLGCGPATQLAQVAGLNPDTSFLGVDLSPRMLASATSHIAALRLANVRVMQGDITRLEGIQDKSMDAVISTLTLHHLPSHAHLLACFGEIARVLKPSGALYLVDFGRLKFLRSVLYFAYMNAKHQPHVFSLDYERSLRAAFLQEELRAAALERLPGHARVYSTFRVPLLVVVKTGPRPLNPAQAQQLARMRRKLSPRYRADLDDLRLFFRMGGLDTDPFRT
jgi:ubiquinone/menaquinone biosynthesis C-methylase UbiE